jgi:hypothetical protein
MTLDMEGSLKNPMNAAKRDSTVADDALVCAVLDGSGACSVAFATRFEGYLSRQGNFTSTAGPVPPPFVFGSIRVGF